MHAAPPPLHVLDPGKEGAGRRRRQSRHTFQFGPSECQHQNLSPLHGLHLSSKPFFLLDVADYTFSAMVTGPFFEMTSSDFPNPKRVLYVPQANGKSELKPCPSLSTICGFDVSNIRERSTRVRVKWRDVAAAIRSLPVPSPSLPLSHAARGEFAVSNVKLVASVSLLLLSLFE